MKQLKRSQCAILPLVLKGEWYDLIKSGEKKEEYRADTPYWRRRISNFVGSLANGKGHLVVAFSRGYRKPDMFFELKGIFTYHNRYHLDWGEPRGSHYALSLGERVTLTRVGAPASCTKNEYKKEQGK